MPTKITDMIGTYLPSADDANGYLFIADGRSPLMYISNDGACRLANPIYPFDDYDTTIDFTVAGTTGGELVDNGEYAACYCYYDSIGQYYSKPSKFKGYALIGAGNTALSLSRMRCAGFEEVIYPQKLGALLSASYDLSTQFKHKSVFRNRDGEYGLTFPLEQRPFYIDTQTVVGSANGNLIADWQTSGMSWKADAQMDVRQVVNVGAVPPPLFRYIRRVGNRLIGVDMPKYAIASMTLAAAETTTYPKTQCTFNASTELVTSTIAGHGLAVNDVIRFQFNGTPPSLSPCTK